jgi:deoxyribodipyrimidine photo-lyase
VKLSDGKPYTVFTHFFNKAAEVSVRKPQQNTYSNYLSGYSLSEEIKDRKKVDVYNQILGRYNSRIYSKGGRSQCLKILENIRKYQDYLSKKDYPAQEATTGLSAHNKFGTCSIQEIYHTINE